MGWKIGEETDAIDGQTRAGQTETRVEDRPSIEEENLIGYNVLGWEAFRLWGL